MAERVTDEKADPPPNTPPPFLPGTYVVQVPKDQIYRVPPPENAKIAEKYRNPPPQKAPCFSFLSRVGCFLVILLIVLAVLAALLYIFLKPRSPELVIDNVQVITTHHRRQTSNHHEYRIRLRSKNPNSQTSFSYQKGGSASLSYKKEKIATGKMQPFQKSQRSTTLKLSLKDSDKTLPREIRKSFKGKGPKGGIPLSLSISVPVRLKVLGTNLRTLIVQGGCDLKVSTLGEGTRVLSQHCHSKIKS